MTIFLGENAGAGNETRTRDPDLGKVAPHRTQSRDYTGNFGFGYSPRNAQLNTANFGLRSDHCACRGECARAHIGPCPNHLGTLAAGSRYPTRLTWVEGRLLCRGCREPYRPELSRPRRRRIPAAEGELRPSSPMVAK